MSTIIHFSDLEPSSQEAILEFVGTLGEISILTYVGTLKIENGTVKLGGAPVMLPDGIAGNGFVKHTNLPSADYEQIQNCCEVDGCYTLQGTSEAKVRVADGAIFYNGRRVLMPAKI